MKYEIKQAETSIGLVDYLETISDEGIVSTIPMDEANSDYQRYLRWLENPDAELGGTL